MIQDVKITKVSINEHKQVQINMLVNLWDYQENELELLRQAKINGDTLDFSIEWLKVQPDGLEEEMKKKRSQLALLMAEYAKMIKSTEWEVEIALYKKYNIVTRTQLSNVQLDMEIASYRSAIINGVA